MRVITDEKCTSYERIGHPERPERILGTVERLKGQRELPIVWEKPGVCEEEAILRAHSARMVERLKVEEDFDGDTPYFPKIGERARASVGAALSAMKIARGGETVFSLMRPPGHHATRNESMGFCYLNSIAIAALAALADGVKRVAVYDFDVHHGNGTEAILINQPGAAFFSIHQYPCYPGTGGRNVGDNCFNFPVPPQTARGEYRHILTDAQEHLKSFKPELVGISAGFDAYARDPLAQETLEAEDFYWMGKSIRALGVPVFSVLEGGYSDDLPELVLAYLKGVEGK